ncbi:hypothetical protein J2S43_005422 [Catenuloplanes nepalensis]|uniref:Uncharacterized protein n=1 Tax=Catenuloplanes nepalensis TaxID=587533 RepID=A0ABT9MZN4_9ACTN|nr:hypothetical protein [Catenuloplanes nepalensis]MDP9796910.1 hypothetical protein [Catenuloplanes nepalensis]
MNPENTAAFRCARLLLLMLVVEENVPLGIDAERLGAYDFLAAHPLLLARAPDDPDRPALRRAGFDDRALAYASAGQRLVTAQQHLGRDLSTLLGAGMVVLGAAGRVRYRLTPEGRSAASALNAAYARSYADAARIVVRRLRRLSGRRLRQTLRECISHPYLPVSSHLPLKDLT